MSRSDLFLGQLQRNYYNHKIFKPKAFVHRNALFCNLIEECRRSVLRPRRISLASAESGKNGNGSVTAEG